MKNRSKILMVILLVLTCFPLSPQAQITKQTPVVVQTPVPLFRESTFSCRKLESDVALKLKVTNNGPDAVKKGTVVHYFYVIPAMPKGNTATLTGTYTLDHKVKKGETFTITIDAGWRTRLISCAVSLKPFSILPHPQNGHKHGQGSRKP